MLSQFPPWTDVAPGFRGRPAGYVLLCVVQPMDLVPMVPLEQMRIDVQGDADTTMTKLLLDVLNIGALLNKETGISMATIVEADTSKPCTIQTGEPTFE